MSRYTRHEDTRALCEQRRSAAPSDIQERNPDMVGPKPSGCSRAWRAASMLSKRLGSLGSRCCGVACALTGLRATRQPGVAHREYRTGAHIGENAGNEAPLGFVSVDSEHANHVIRSISLRAVQTGEQPSALTLGSVGWLTVCSCSRAWMCP